MNKLYLLAILLAATAILGCSGGSGSPLTPGTWDNSSLNGGQMKTGVSDYLPDGTPSGGSALLGLFEVTADGKSLNGEMVPVRNSSLTDVLETVDITGFLSNSPCGDCAKLASIGLDADNNIVLKLGIRHPFAVGDPSKSISGKNRADLHVFNVEGIVVSSGVGSPTNFTGLSQSIGPRVLLNPDGYTGYLDQYFDEVLPTPETLHPYILHFDDYSNGNFAATNPMGFASVTTPPPSGNLVMPMGSDYNYKDYTFKIGTGNVLDFFFAIGCTYGVSTNTFEDRFTPEFRVPQYNKKAASEVSVEIGFNNLAAGIVASNAKLNVKVLDINHGVAVGSGIDQMKMDSSVKTISVDVPGVTSTPAVNSNPIAISGSGRNPADPLLFEVFMQNSAGAAAGNYVGLVKVLDAYLPGSNTHPFIGTKDGAKRVPPTSSPLTGLFEIPEFATYQVFDISVGSAPVNPIVTVNAVPTEGNVPLQVQFSVDVILAPGATIQSYDWTFGDGGVSSAASPLYTYNDPGVWTAKCIVTDSFNNTGEDTIDITGIQPGPSYVGSATCRTCHSAIGNEWADHGHHFILNKVNGGAPTYPFSAVPNPPSGTTWADTSYVIGGYKDKALFMDASGKVITGPDVQWNLATTSFAKYLTDTRGTADYDCGKCHSTGWVSFANNGGVHQDGLVGIMGTWAEPGVTCEQCHGMGSLHVVSPSPANITRDPSAALCGQCHTRGVTTKIYAEINLLKNEQTYNEFLASPHSGLTCVTCHSSHASTVKDSQAVGTGLIKVCTDCHDAATHQVTGDMSTLKCTDCHMPYADVAATVTGTGVHQYGDVRTHIFKPDATGVKLADYFSTDGIDTWITPDINGKVKLNLAFACMQCHDGTRAFSMTSYTMASARATGIHQ